MSIENENINLSVGEQPKKRSPKKSGKILDIMAYILCLVIAFGIWAYVMYTENNDYEYQFTSVVVELDGASALKENYGLTPISGYGTEVTITVKGPRSEVQKYTADDIFAYVDLSSVNRADRHSLEVNVDLPGNIQLVSAEPSKINVFVDETIDKQVPIVIDTIYTSADNVTVFDPIIDDGDVIDGKITVTGPKSVVEFIDHALIVKDLGVITTGVKFNSQFTLIDTSGDEVTNPYVKTDVTDVSVSVKAELEKFVSLEAHIKDADSKYKYTVTWKYDGEIIENVKVKGDPIIVSGFDSIIIEIPYDDIHPNGNVPLPEGFEIYVGDNRIRTVYYTVVKELINSESK